MHYNTGWVVIGIIGFNVAVNILVEVWQITVGLYRLWMKFYNKIIGRKQVGMAVAKERVPEHMNTQCVTSDMPRLKLS
jgi:hypothetical protein